MTIDYGKLSKEEFDEKLAIIITDEPMLDIPGVYELLAQRYNLDVLEWAADDAREDKLLDARS